MGAVWRLDVRSPRDGTRTYAAKELFWEVPSDDDVAVEVAFTDLCRDAGVSCPRALPTRSGRYLVHDPGGQAWRVYEWVHGTVPDVTDRTAVRWLAGQLGRIHALAVAPAAGATVHPFYRRVDVDWPALAEVALAEHAAWASNLKEALPKLTELTNLVNSARDEPTVICHRDPKVSNVIAGSAGRWLVDWDNSGPMAPARELGLLMMPHVADPEALASIGASYAEHGGPARLGDAEGFAVGAATWLNFLAGQADIMLNPDADPEHRAYAEPRVVGLIRLMPTVRDLERAARVAAG
jgi:hypothetical protein